MNLHTFDLPRITFRQITALLCLYFGIVCEIDWVNVFNGSENNIQHRRYTRTTQVSAAKIISLHQVKGIEGQKNWREKKTNVQRIELNFKNGGNFIRSWHILGAVECFNLYINLAVVNFPLEQTFFGHLVPLTDSIQSGNLRTYTFSLSVRQDFQSPEKKKSNPKYGLWLHRWFDYDLHVRGVNYTRQCLCMLRSFFLPFPTWFNAK